MTNTCPTCKGLGLTAGGSADCETCEGIGRVVVNGVAGVSEDWDDIRLRGAGSARDRARLADGFRRMFQDDEDLSDVEKR